MKNKSIKEIRKSIDFQTYLDKKLKDPEFKRLYDEEGKKLEIAYKVLQLRKKQGISQAQFAKKLGTTQSNVARLEAGQQNFTTATLQKIAAVFNRELRIEFV